MFDAPRGDLFGRVVDVKLFENRYNDEQPIEREPLAKLSRTLKNEFAARQ